MYHRKKCGLENLKVTVIEKVRIKTVENLENREGHWHRQLFTIRPHGMNVRKEFERGTHQTLSGIITRAFQEPILLFGNSSETWGTTIASCPLDYLVVHQIVWDCCSLLCSCILSHIIFIVSFILSRCFSYQR